MDADYIDTYVHEDHDQRSPHIEGYDPKDLEGCNVDVRHRHGKGMRLDWERPCFWL